MNIKFELTKMIKTEYIKAFSDTALLVVLTTLPTLFSFIVIIFNIAEKPSTILYGKGELYLYTISFSGSAFIIYKQLNNELFKTCGNLIIALLLFVSCLFTVVSFESISTRVDLILYSSIILLLISIPLLFHSQVLSNRQSPPDIGEYRKEEQQKIEDAVS